MSLALVYSRARAGVEAPLVRVEVHLSGGLPATQIVGLAETSVRESRERVRAALLCARFDFPQRRITLNLAPADLPKEGGRYDLAIALGILAASGQIPPQSLLPYEFLGELGLTGELRPVAGALPAAIAAAEAGRILVVPPGNAAESALAEHADVRVARTLLECCAGLGNPRLLPQVERVDTTPLPLPDLADVRGQVHARRALEVAAAGGHHLLPFGRHYTPASPPARLLEAEPPPDVGRGAALLRLACFRPNRLNTLSTCVAVHFPPLLVGQSRSFSHWANWTRFIPGVSMLAS